LGTPNIADAVDGFDSVGLQSRNRRLQVGFLPAADGDASAVTAQHAGDLETQAGAAPGDQCHLSLQQIGPERALVDVHADLLIVSPEVPRTFKDYVRPSPAVDVSAVHSKDRHDDSWQEKSDTTIPGAWSGPVDHGAGAAARAVRVGRQLHRPVGRQ